MSGRLEPDSNRTVKPRSVRRRRLLDRGRVAQPRNSSISTAGPYHGPPLHNLRKSHAHEGSLIAARAALQEAYRDDKQGNLERPAIAGRSQKQHVLDTGALDALELQYLRVLDQLPSWDTAPRDDPAFFDWSGQTNYTATISKVLVPFTCHTTLASAGSSAVQVTDPS